MMATGYVGPNGQWVTAVDIPANAGSVVSPTDEYGNGTRQYNFAQGTRTAYTATSSAAVAIGTLGTSRELMLISSSRCWIRWGASDVAAAAAEAGVLVLPQDTLFHLRVPAGVTHFRVIRDSADGNLSTYPVA